MHTHLNKKHMLLMLACCLVPLAGFIAISVFDIPFRQVFYLAMILFCPLSHLLMMKFMVHDETGKHHSVEGKATLQPNELPDRS